MDMEKIYLTMKRTGAGNIVLGILSICIGLASGIMLIITGANLLKKKKHLRFSIFLYFFTFDNNDIKYGKNRP